jgi:hypothetical protein
MKIIASLLFSTTVIFGLSACNQSFLPNVVTQSQLQMGHLTLGEFDSQLGQNLAQYAISQNTGGTGYCYQYVAQAIHAHLPGFLSGNHAYLAADQLAVSPYFKEVAISPEQLTLLPAGAVVVWSQGSSESGHISIADGRGNEVSDHIGPQMRSHYGGGVARVFVPVP